MPTKKKLVPGMTEAQVLAGVLEACRIMGVEVQRQNTGGLHNPRGQYVPFGEAGDSDVRGQIPAGWPGAGKLLLIECKREGFDPCKSRGKERDRFNLQRDRLRETCENGGYGFMVDDARQVIATLTRIREGWRIVWDGDYAYVTDEEEG